MIHIDFQTHRVLDENNMVHIWWSPWFGDDGEYGVWYYSSDEPNVDLDPEHEYPNCLDRSGDFTTHPFDKMEEEFRREMLAAGLSEELVSAALTYGKGLYTAHKATLLALVRTSYEDAA